VPIHGTWEDLDPSKPLDIEARVAPVLPPDETARMAEPLSIEFVTPGSRTAADIASELCAFISPATRSLDVAIYDFDARNGASASVGDALEAAAPRGV
jgi:hypothetical protein